MWKTAPEAYDYYTGTGTEAYRILIEDEADEWRFDADGYGPAKFVRDVGPYRLTAHAEENDDGEGRTFFNVGELERVEVR